MLIVINFSRLLFIYFFLVLFHFKTGSLKNKNINCIGICSLYFMYTIILHKLCYYNIVYYFLLWPDSSQNNDKLQLTQFLNFRNKILRSVNSYLVVKQLFIQSNTNFSSSVPIRRLFSFTSFIMALSRSRLFDEQFKKFFFKKLQLQRLIQYN